MFFVLVIEKKKKIFEFTFFFYLIKDVCIKQTSWRGVYVWRADQSKGILLGQWQESHAVDRRVPIEAVANASGRGDIWLVVARALAPSGHEQHVTTIKWVFSSFKTVLFWFLTLLFSFSIIFSIILLETSYYCCYYVISCHFNQFCTLFFCVEKNKCWILIFNFQLSNQSIVRHNRALVHLDPFDTIFVNTITFALVCLDYIAHLCLFSLGPFLLKLTVPWATFTRFTSPVLIRSMTIRFLFLYAKRTWFINH